jgi:hypothetical protein
MLKEFPTGTHSYDSKVSAESSRRQRNDVLTPSFGDATDDRNATTATRQLILAFASCQQEERPTKATQDQAQLQRISQLDPPKHILKHNVT